MISIYLTYYKNYIIMMLNENLPYVLNILGGVFNMIVDDKKEVMEKDLENYLNIINEKFNNYAQKPNKPIYLCCCGC